MGLDRLLPAGRVMRMASEGLLALSELLTPSSNAAGDTIWDCGSEVRDDVVRIAPGVCPGGTGLNCWCSAHLDSNDGRSFSGWVNGWAPLTVVEEDDILEWDPDVK